MTTNAMRLALSAWVRHPREMALANAGWVLSAALPLPLLRWLPAGPAQAAGLALMLGWAWVGYSWLCAVTVRIGDGDGAAFTASYAWLRTQWKERVAAFLLAALILAWWSLALNFYLKVALPAWLAWPLLALVGGTGLWLGLSLLLSMGVAAEGGRPWRAVWKASALLPLAYFPSALAAGLLALLLSGAPVLLLGIKHWSAPLLLAPLLLSPFFTAAWSAAYLGFLGRALLDRAMGRDAAPAPAWRELWNPWR